MTTAYMEMNAQYSSCSIVHNYVEIYSTKTMKINYTEIDKNGFIDECCKLANLYLVDNTNQLNVKYLVLVTNDTFNKNDFIQNKILNTKIQKVAVCLS